MLIRPTRNAANYAMWTLTGMRAHPRLLLAMWRVERRLPALMSLRALPELMQTLTPRAENLSIPPTTVRQLADAVAGLDVTSPLGICLRRSLLRYHFLRRAGVPVQIQFGARFTTDRNIGGHAWLTLDSQPYFEENENYLGFAVLYTFPLAST
jgi:hypothetical protein